MYLVRKSQARGDVPNREGVVPVNGACRHIMRRWFTGKGLRDSRYSGTLVISPDAPGRVDFDPDRRLWVQGFLGKSGHITIGTPDKPHGIRVWTAKGKVGFTVTSQKGQTARKEVSYTPNRGRFDLVVLQIRQKLSGMEMRLTVNDREVASATLGGFLNGQWTDFRGGAPVRLSGDAAWTAVVTAGGAGANIHANNTPVLYNKELLTARVYNTITETMDRNGTWQRPDGAALVRVFVCGAPEPARDMGNNLFDPGKNGLFSVVTTTQKTMPVTLGAISSTPGHTRDLSCATKFGPASSHDSFDRQAGLITRTVAELNDAGELTAAKIFRDSFLAMIPIVGRDSWARKAMEATQQAENDNRLPRNLTYAGQVLGPPGSLMADITDRPYLSKGGVITYAAW